MKDVPPRQASSFWRSGCLGPFDLCSADEAQDFVQQLRATVLDTDGPCMSDERGQSDRHSCRHLDREFVRRMCLAEPITTRIGDLLGNEFVLFLSRFWIKEGPNQEIPWHQDLTYFAMYPKICVNAYVALTDMNRENGCLCVLPGSHWHVLPEVAADSDMAFPVMSDPRLIDGSRTMNVEMRAGQFILFDGNLLHRSDANRTNVMRAALNVSFTAPFVYVEKDFFFLGHRTVPVTVGSADSRMRRERDVAPLPTAGA